MGERIMNLAANVSKSSQHFGQWIRQFFRDEHE
jgi:hypothetical protein